MNTYETESENIQTSLPSISGITGGRVNLIIIWTELQNGFRSGEVRQWFANKKASQLLQQWYYDSLFFLALVVTKIHAEIFLVSSADFQPVRCLVTILVPL